MVFTLLNAREFAGILKAGNVYHLCNLSKHTVKQPSLRGVFLSLCSLSLSLHEKKYVNVFK